MVYKTVEAYLLSKKGAFKDFPFGPGAAVFKVAGKMFALVAWQDKPLRMTLKCDPDDAYALRSMFDTVEPAYHMNKEHWNTITFDGTVPKGVLLQMIDDSYGLVVKGLRKADRVKLERS